MNDKTNETMNTTNTMNTNASKWKKALKWVALIYAAIVLLDWLLDGRLRKLLPGRRRDQGQTQDTKI